MAVASFAEAAERTWARVVDRARQQLPESSFSMWFVGVRATSLHDGVLEVVAPSEYVRDRLAKNYLDLIQAAATDALGHPIRIHLGSDPEPVRPPLGEPPPPPPTRHHAAADDG